MADLGNLGNDVYEDFGIRINVNVPFYADTGDVEPHLLPCWGKISGAVVYSSTPLVSKRVELIYKPNGTLVGVTATDINGLFEFDGIYIGGSINTYSVIAFNDTYNARIFTDVQAVDPTL